jgi:hypothetical protein
VAPISPSIQSPLNVKPSVARLNETGRQYKIFLLVLAKIQERKSFYRLSLSLDRFVQPLLNFGATQLQTCNEAMAPLNEDREVAHNHDIYNIYYIHKYLRVNSIQT